MSLRVRFDVRDVPVGPVKVIYTMISSPRSCAHNFYAYHPEIE